MGRDDLNLTITYFFELLFLRIRGRLLNLQHMRSKEIIGLRCNWLRILKLAMPPKPTTSFGQKGWTGDNTQLKE